MLYLVDVHRQMLEGLGQRSPGSLDGDGPGLDGGLHSLGDLNQLKGVELLHFPSENFNNSFNFRTHKNTAQGNGREISSYKILIIHNFCILTKLSIM